MSTNNKSKAALRARAEAKVKNMLEPLRSFSMKEVKKVLHELEVHQIELEMQNHELRDSQQRLEVVGVQYTDLFDFAPLGYLILDEKGIIQNLNLTACAMLGLERLRIIGKPLSAYISRVDSDVFFLRLRSAFNTGLLPSFELQMKHHDGIVFTTLLNGNISEDHGKTVCRISMQDITELRKAEAQALKLQNEATRHEKEAIEHYNTELEKTVRKRTRELSDALESEKQINEMKTAIVSIASHELRTPLTILKSSITLIEKFHEMGQFDREEKHIALIKSTIKHFTNILNDFLSLDKLERGTVRVNKELFDLQEFIRQIMEETEGILKKEQHINYSHKGNITVNGDKKILHNVLLNLLSNAIKYSVDIIEIHTQIQNGRMTLKVIDKGIGIPIEDQKHLFTRFFRAKNVKDFQGTGLGLSIVERYLELVGGTITFTSEENKGSTFTIVIH